MGPEGLLCDRCGNWVDRARTTEVDLCAPCKTELAAKRRRHTRAEKVARIATRIYRAGFENMRAATVPCGSGCNSGNWRQISADKLRTDKLRSLLTRRLQRMIERQS